MVKELFNDLDFFYFYGTHFAVFHDKKSVLKFDENMFDLLQNKTYKKKDFTSIRKYDEFTLFLKENFMIDDDGLLLDKTIYVFKLLPLQNGDMN